MSNIQSYLPKKVKKTSNVQGRVPEEVYVEAKKIMDRENLNWSDVLTACLRHLIDEKKGRTSYDKG